MRKQRTKGGFPTKRAAQAFLTEALRRIDEGSYSPPVKITVGAFVNDEWLPAVSSTLRLDVATDGHMLKHLEPVAGVRLQALRATQPKRALRRARARRPLAGHDPARR